MSLRLGLVGSALLLVTLACNVPAQSKKHPAALVGKWRYAPAWPTSDFLLLEANGRAIQTGTGDKGGAYRYARFWRGDANGKAFADTLRWAVGEQFGSPQICFSGDLIGQKQCERLFQSDAKTIQLGTEDGGYGFKNVRVTADASGQRRP